VKTDKESIMKRIRDGLARLVGVTGKDARRQRWELRRAERAEQNVRIRRRPATKRGDSKGAFGKCHGPFDPRQPAKAGVSQQLAK
jgi:hypothetical protein